MFIKAPHIYLRALESSDVDVLYTAENNMAVWKVSNTLTPYSKDVLKLYLQTAHQDIYVTKQLRLLICENATNNAIGTIDLFDFEPLHGRIGVGVLIFEAYRKNGYAFETIELIKDYAHNTLLLNQLFCNISSTNTESINLFKKCGFQNIGTKKYWNKISATQFEDELMYQLVF